MSNLSEFVNLFNTMGNIDKGDAAAVGAMLGTAADLAGSGIFGLAVDIGARIVNEMFPNHNRALSGEEKFLVQLRAALEKFFEAEIVRHRLDRLQKLATDIGPAQRAFEDLPKELQDPALSEDFKVGQINVCGGILDGLEPITQFATDFLEEKYYEDPWIGQVAPQQFSGGLAFSTKYILPSFLRALVYFVTVGSAFDRNFVSNNRQVLERYLERLQFVYDTYVQGAHGTELDTEAGIVSLPAPTLAELLGKSASGIFFGRGRFCAGLWASGREKPLQPPFPPPPSQDFYQMYGAVDRYAGYFAVGNFPGVPLPGPEPHFDPPPDDFFPIFSANHAIQTLNAWKHVFLGLGLDTLHEAINAMHRLLGTPLLSDFPSGSWWSLRETRDALGDVFPDPTPPLVHTTAKGTIGRLARLGGLSTDQQLSWRSSLSAVLIPIALQGPPPI